LFLADCSLRSKQIAGWAKSLAATYVYFDNDQAGYATRNALTLKKVVLGNSVADFETPRLSASVPSKDRKTSSHS